MKKYIEEYLKKHPCAQPQDIIKLCYQAARGGEHLLADAVPAKEYFDKEYLETPEKDEPLFEQISENFCRVNIGAWKREGRDKDQLFDLFLKSAAEWGRGEDKLSCYLEEADSVISLAEISFTRVQWQECLDKYKKSGMPALHHSSLYRESEKPAYRIVNIRFIKK